MSRKTQEKSAGIQGMQEGWSWIPVFSGLMSITSNVQLITIDAASVLRKVQNLLPLPLADRYNAVVPLCIQEWALEDHFW